MLSVNSNPTTAMAFKGKPCNKELKKFSQTLKKLQFDPYLDDPRKFIGEKQEALFKESIPKFIKLWKESIAKKFVDKILKK